MMFRHPDEEEEYDYQMFAKLDYIREAYGPSAVPFDDDPEPPAGMWQCPRCFRWFNEEEKDAHEKEGCAPPPAPQAAPAAADDEDVPF